MQSRPEKDKTSTAPTVEALNEATPTLTKGFNMNNSTQTSGSNAALIPVFNGVIDGQTVHLCCARVLHAFMDVKRDFTTWIKGRIHKFGFVEGSDYLLTKSGKQVSPPIW